MNERAKLQELLKALEERLHELRLKKARTGFDMPPHDIVEMKEIEEEIRELESQIPWYDDSVTSNHIPKVVCPIIEQLKRLGTGGKVTIYILEIQLDPQALEM